jgi:hypothetical protein
MLYYQVKREDLMKCTSFKWAKVLQTNYDSNNWRDITSEFLVHMKVLKQQVLYNYCTMEEANVKIRKLVIIFTNKYPADFPHPSELGWYSKSVLVDMFTSGQVIIGGHYDINTMQEEWATLTQIIEEDKVALALSIETAKEAQQLALERKEATRIPLAINMLIDSKKSIAEAFQHLYPKGTTLSAIVKEITNLVDTKYGSHKGATKQSWLIEAIHVDGGMVYPEDILNDGK